MPDPDPRAGTRFAVYLCPPQDDPYYQLGSGLLGYDVRARREVALPDFLRPEWQAQAGPYGLHLTLLEGFYCDPDDWAAIEREAAACVAGLSPGADLVLTNGRVEAWEDGRVLVQRFDASRDLYILHTLLLARLSPFVTRSPFDDELASHPERYPAAYERTRLKLLRTPRGLDSWQPHYTLVQPYGGDDAAGLVERLQTLTAPYAGQRHRSVSLFRKDAGETHWQVARDLPLGDAPPAGAQPNRQS